MSPDAPWLERAAFFGLHLHSSWLLLPAASLGCFLVLALLSRFVLVGASIYRLFLLSFGILPLLIYTAKDVSLMLARASQGTEQALKYAYLVLGLPTLVLFVVAVALLVADIWSSASREGAVASWRMPALALVFALCIFQSLWLYEADASL